MTEDSRSFRALLHDLRAGIDVAIKELTAEFEPTILAEVVRRWQPALNAACDPADVAQEVWLVFFTKALPRETFDQPCELRAFLVVLAHAALIDEERRHLHCQGRDRRRQRSLHHLTPAEADTLTDPVPSPAVMVCAEDACQRLLAAQGPSTRAIVELLQQGFTQVEIAERLSLPLRTVHCLLERLRAPLLAEGDERPDSLPERVPPEEGAELAIAC